MSRCQGTRGRKDAFGIQAMMPQDFGVLPASRDSRHAEQAKPARRVSGRGECRRDTLALAAGNKMIVEAQNRARIAYGLRQPRAVDDVEPRQVDDFDAQPFAPCDFCGAHRLRQEDRAVTDDNDVGMSC